MTIALILAAALLGAPAASAMDPVLGRLIPPDSRRVWGANIERIKTSPSWPLFQTVVDSNGNRFRDVAAEAGFDPRLHLQEVIVASACCSMQPLVILRGVFDPSRVAAIDRIAVEKVRKTYRGVEVIVPAADAALEPALLEWQPTWTALVQGYAIIGPRSEVSSAIDRYRGLAHTSASLETRIRSARERFDAWLVATQFLDFDVVYAEWYSLSEQQQNARSQPWQVTAGVRIGPHVSVTGEASAASAQEAGVLVGLALKFVALKRARMESNRIWTDLVDRLQLFTEGSQAKLHVILSADEFDDLLPMGRQTW